MYWPRFDQWESNSSACKIVKDDSFTIYYHTIPYDTYHTYTYIYFIYCVVILFRKLDPNTPNQTKSDFPNRSLSLFKFQFQFQNYNYHQIFSCSSFSVSIVHVFILTRLLGFFFSTSRNHAQWWFSLPLRFLDSTTTLVSFRLFHCANCFSHVVVVEFCRFCWRRRCN